MCFSGLFGKKTTTNTTKTTALPEVMKNYSYINDLAKTASQRPFQQYGTQASDFVAQMNAQQNAGINGINASVNAYQPYFQNATAATQAGMGPAYQGIDNYMSPYIKNVADTTGALMKQQYEQAQSGALGTAASSGAFGGDRAGIAAANMQQQNQLGYGNAMANIMNQGYTQALGASQADLARQLQGGAQMAGLGAQAQQLGLAGGQAQIAAGTMQQQTEQAGKDALINQFMQEQGYPFQTAQFLANIYSMTGPSAGSQTTNTQQGSFWSDRRLKHDVERIGHTDDGQPIYRFKYNGSNQTQIGLMADQVEKHHPDAVGTDPKTGYQYVDYDRATRMAKGGGVAGPYQIEIGSTPGGSGYVSQNYVKPSEMLLADPSWIDSVTQQNEQRKTGLQDFIDNIGDIKSKWNEFQGLVQPKATGGSVDDKKTPQELGYLQPVLDAMKPLDAQGLAGASTSGGGGGGSGAGQSGLDKAVKIVDTGIKIANFLGLKDGGVAGGRHGYATDGGVNNYSTEALRREMAIRNFDPKYLEDQRKQQQANVNAAMTATSSNPTNMGRSYPTTGVAPAPRTTSQMNADVDQVLNEYKAEQSNMGHPNITAPVSAVAPLYKPENTSDTPVYNGLVPSNLAPTSSPRPMPRPADLNGGVGGANVAADATRTLNVTPTVIDVPAAPRATLGSEQRPISVNPVDFYDTHIIRQESGDNQFDKNGNPLTSSAGAVGAGQIMEATGPEAAKLAGLPWDRDRWLHDKEYNKAIGRAYFLDQYNKFGSLDKAAAAYNAGPGAVASAMDRALALGGSYLDYLPAETQGYVRSTTGTGGLGSSQKPSATGVKPYEDRNFLGQIFHNQDDGKLNKDAVMSLLSGVGTMLASPSPFFLPTLGAGLAGAANTYMAREGQRSDITAQNIENTKRMQTAFLQAKSLGYPGNIEEFSRAQGQQTGPFSGASSGDGSEPVTLNGVVVRNGITIPKNQDYQSLLDFVHQYQGAEADPNDWLGQQVIQARHAIEKIETTGSTIGYTVDENGVKNQVEMPVEAAIQAQNQVAATTGMQQNRDEFNKQRIDAVANINQMNNTIGNMEKTLTDYRAGALASAGSAIGALLQFTGADMNAMPDFVKNPEKYTEAAKDAALLQRSQLEIIPGGAPAASIQFTNTFTPNPDMPPAAVRELLINMKAGNEYQRQYYEGFRKWASEHPSQETDIQAYQDEFSKDRDKRYNDIVASIAAKTPHFKGDVPPGVDTNWFNSQSLQRQQEAWALYNRGALNGRGN